MGVLSSQIFYDHRKAQGDPDWKIAVLRAAEIVRFSEESDNMGITYRWNPNYERNKPGSPKKIMNCAWMNSTLGTDLMFEIDQFGLQTSTGSRIWGPNIFGDTFRLMADDWSVMFRIGDVRDMTGFYNLDYREQIEAESLAYNRKYFNTPRADLAEFHVTGSLESLKRDMVYVILLMGGSDIQPDISTI